MASSTFRRGRRPGRPARPMDWWYALADTTGVANGVIACEWVLPPSLANELFTDPTLMATRLFAEITVGTPVVVGLVTGAALGLIAWDGNPSDDLVPPCPGPITDGDADWIVRYAVPRPSSTVAAGSFTLVLDGSHLSEARRRLGNNRGILWAVENMNFTSVAASADIRLLIKE